MARAAKPIDAETLNAAAKARGIVIPAAKAKSATAGASWLRECVTLLRKAGFK